MTGQKFTIIFAGDVGFISPDNALTAEQLDIDHMGGTFKPGAYWVITVIKYLPSEQRIVAHLHQSNIGEVSFTQEQLRFQDQLNEIKKISFRTLDTSMVLSTIGSFAHKVTDTTTTGDSLLHHVQKQSLEDWKNTPSQKIIIEPLPPQPIYINESFGVRIKNLEFQNGKVSVSRFFKQAGKSLVIDINNEFLRQEFDAIKNYFEHVLQTKKITVFVAIQLLDGVVTSIKTIAPDIDRINKEVIENVRLHYVKNIICKTQGADSDKLLYTMEELLDEEASGISKVFYQNENELAEDLIKITSSKHYKHLRLLSHMHDSKCMKLRFAINPFSFLLLISGKEQVHFVWETLDTEEATYIWHVGKEKENLPFLLSQIEEKIKYIKANGKTNYINSSEDDYTRIFHDYSPDINGFLKWKEELEAAVR